MNASGKWYLPVDKREFLTGEDGPHAKLSTEQLRRLAIEQETIEANKRDQQERTNILHEFLRETPSFTSDAKNNGLLEARLRDLVKARGALWPDWKREELYSAFESLCAEGAIVISGKPERKTPTETEMYEMPMRVLRRRARGVMDEDSRSPLDEV